MLLLSGSQPSLSASEAGNCLPSGTTSSLGFSLPVPGVYSSVIGASGIAISEATKARATSSTF